MLERRAASSGGDGGKLTSIRRSLGGWRMQRGPVASGRVTAARDIVSACGVLPAWRSGRMRACAMKRGAGRAGGGRRDCRAKRPGGRKSPAPRARKAAARETVCADVRAEPETCSSAAREPRVRQEHKRAEGALRSRLCCVFQRSLWPRAALHAPTSAPIIPLGASQRKRHRVPIEQ